MALIQVKVIAGVFTAPQKREIVERLTGVMVDIEGENMRELTWCVVEEIGSGDWGIGGQPLSADDVRALARASRTIGIGAGGSDSRRPTTPNRDDDD